MSRESRLGRIISLPTMIKFILHGQMHYHNGWIMNNHLSYLADTEQEAIDTCKRLNPNFFIHSITHD